VKLRITILKYHSWYLCQISLQIVLLPVLINRTKRTKKNSKPWSDPLSVRNKYTNDPTKISDVLNIHFSSVGRKLASKIPPTYGNFTEYLSSNYSESFFFNPVTALEIENEIVSIPVNKAHGLYSCIAQPESCALLSTFWRNLLQKLWIYKMTPVSNFMESDYWIYVLILFVSF